MTVKVATSKRNPAIAYALVGAKRGFAEIAKLNAAGKLLSLRRRRRGKKLRQGVYAVKGQNLKNIGSIARKQRLDPKHGLIQRRKPTRYLHLIELGGKARKIRAGHFLDKAARSSASASMQAFNRVFIAGLNREFARMAAK